MLCVVLNVSETLTLLATLIKRLTELAKKLIALRAEPKHEGKEERVKGKRARR